MFFSTKLKAVLVSTLVSTSVLGLTSCLTLNDTKNETKQDENFVITSPDNQLTLEVAWQQGLSPQYRVSFNHKPVVLPSIIDMRLQGDEQAEHDLVFLSEEIVDENYLLPWGQFNQAHNQFKTVKFNLLNQATQQVISVLEFRVFDDAVAFRHIFKDIHLAKNQMLTEQAQFTFAHDPKVWSYRGERQPQQTNSLIKANAQQLLLPAVLTSEHLPALAIQEASRTETAPIKLKTNPGSSRLSVVTQALSTDQLPNSTAWRVLQVANKAGDLITAQTLINLSPPNKIADTSWIKTGKSFWDWRVRGQQYGDHTYALDNESLRRMIDFAAEHGMQYVMIDANWYGPEHKVSSDPFTEIEGLNIKNLIQQAQQKNIGFILYLNDMASKNHDLDKLFETWASWGAAGVKYGFMKLDGKEKVAKTLNIVELAAKHKLLINFHDSPIVPSGMRRTWPNWVTREAVHGQTDGKRSFTPSGFIEMAHVNSLAGPLDMSNGFFQLNGLVENRKYVRSEVYSTVASEVARTLVIFSGLVILPDSPEAYLAKKDLFEFLQKMPTSWDESRVLTSDIDHHIVTARKQGDEWFVGAVVNEQGGQLSVPLDFLDSQYTYQAKVYADAPETHYQTNREAYQIYTLEVKKGDSLNMQFAPGGGQAVWFAPIKKVNAL